MKSEAVAGTVEVDDEEKPSATPRPTRWKSIFKGSGLPGVAFGEMVGEAVSWRRAVQLAQPMFRLLGNLDLRCPGCLSCTMIVTVGKEVPMARERNVGLTLAAAGAESWAPASSSA